MYQLILVYSFMTTACTVGDGMTSATVPQTDRYVCVTNMKNPHDGTCHRFPLPPMCSPYQDHRYVKLDKYQTYGECMERVAKVGEFKGLKAVCHRGARQLGVGGEE